jgi:hypothetical protein
MENGSWNSIEQNDICWLGWEIEIKRDRDGGRFRELRSRVSKSLFWMWFFIVVISLWKVKNTVFFVGDCYKIDYC